MHIFVHVGPIAAAGAGHHAIVGEGRDDVGRPAQSDVECNQCISICYIYNGNEVREHSFGSDDISSLPSGIQE